MDYLPVFLNIKDRKSIVVGGGEVAARKISLLLNAGGQVEVIAPQICDTIKEWVKIDKVSHNPKNFDDDDLQTPCLVIAATSDEKTNRQVSQAAKAKRLPVNVVDHPQLCDFIIPSIVDRSPIVVAISSGGSSPVLARLLRSRLESLVPATYGNLATLLAEYREQVRKKFKTSRERRRFWESIIQGPVAELLFAGKHQAAREALTRAVTKSKQTDRKVGEVYLVGAGPGDPDLLTFRALRLMQQADVVLYDRLVTKPILELTRRDAKHIYVGKQRGDHVVPQKQINQLLIDLAKQGDRVLRLKGGDPFIFGRGGEEIDKLMDNHIPFQVVPGVTAATGCAAYAGIPLTHRDYSQTCIFVTGHLKEGTLDLNWKSLVQPKQTIVVYMGLIGLECLCTQLIEHGMPPTMPAALVERGTTPHQRVFTGDLSSLPRIVRQATITPPTLIIIGEVVKLQEKLAWLP